MDAGDLEGAEKAFYKAARGKTAARAFSGLGLVNARRPRISDKALYYFQRALGADRKFVEAQLNIARLHAKLRNDDATGAFETAFWRKPDLTLVSDGLMQLAWQISETPQGEKFHKEEVWVVTMPSRSYRVDQGAYVYYEIYNLKRDPFGRTRYQVDYAIRRRGIKGKGVWGMMVAGYDLLFAGREPKVSVSYERFGDKAFERVYFELETENLGPGMYQIEVTVTDLDAEGRALKKAIFVLGQER